MKALIFDLDGVVADTAAAHARSWAKLAAEMGVRFDAEIGAQLLGRTREDAMRIFAAGRALDRAAELEWLVRKQAYFLVELADMGPTDVLPGVLPLIAEAREAGLGVALASSSRNAHAVIERLDLAAAFDVVADGASVARPKPAPDIFLWAADRLAAAPRDCVVFEDAAAGVEAAIAGGFPVVALGLDDARATWRRRDLAGAQLSDFGDFPPREPDGVSFIYN